MWGNLSKLGKPKKLLYDLFIALLFTTKVAWPSTTLKVLCFYFKHYYSSAAVIKRTEEAFFIKNICLGMSWTKAFLLGLLWNIY